MKKIVVLFLLSFLVGCEVPAFERDLCVDSCNQCMISTCDAICTLLQDGYANPSCEQITDDVWNCSISAQCDFPTECQSEIRQFLMCE